ncbi:MAG: CvpA family protein [Desulfobacteraceae bacterium]|nr:CvpA family protein [Desulfobacteraceae bacterium]MCF8095456.1 CvpA family protein [Desulfobacteraceae bacterium]
MNPFDMVVVVILGYCVIRGAFRGIIKEASAIIGVLGGFYAAFMFHHTLAPVFSGFVDNTDYRYFAAFLVLFCGVFAASVMAGMLVRALVQLMLLGVVDRTFGSVFGAVKGVIVVSLLFFLLSFFLPRGTSRAMIEDSKLAPHVNTVAAGIIRVVPEDAREALAARLQELKLKWEEQNMQHNKSG